MSKRPPRNYLSNYNLLEQIALSKQEGKMNNELLNMLTLLCERYATRANFSSYTYLDEMKMNALLNLCRTWASFNAEKSSNPFAYYTQTVKNSFIQYLKIEKKQRDIRDMLLVMYGANPSYTYQLEHEMDGNALVDPSRHYIRRDNYEFMESINTPDVPVEEFDELEMGLSKLEAESDELDEDDF
jgi:hypothetical protein